MRRPCRVPEAAPRVAAVVLASGVAHRHLIGGRPLDPHGGPMPVAQSGHGDQPASPWGQQQALKSSPSHREAPHGHGGDYREVIRAYVENLQEYCSRSSTALRAAKERVESVNKVQTELPAAAKRDAIWSLAPVLVMMWLYVRDTADRSYAQYAHRCIKEHAQLHSNVKFVKL